MAEKLEELKDKKLTIIEDFNLSDDLKEKYLKRKTEIVGVIENYKTTLKTLQGQYKKLVEEKALYEVVAKLGKTNEVLKPFVEKANKVLENEKKQNFLKGCSDTIKEVETKIAKVQKIIDKYFTETINPTNNKLEVNKATLIYVEIMDSLE